ncbi:MAG: hypothetical protein JXR71_00430 [Bacteroidales bacterium]|nr:hypothetical protein [Bacteroidales bacterium]
MTRNKVVCDLNVWYEFAKGTINPNLLSHQYLVATFVNITELAQAPNMIKNPRLFGNVLFAIKRNYSSVIKANPWEYLIQAFFNDFQPDISVANKILSGFDAYMDTSPNSIPINVIEETRVEINKVISEKKSISEPINNALIPVRQNIKETGGKKQRHKRTTITSWKRFLSDTALIYSKEFLDKEYKIELDHPSWRHFELLILTFEEYFLRLEISNNRKFHMNDWPDLINLVYVQPSDKYWTFENKWNTLFRETGSLAKYVYGA